jgi:ABC-type multidrug transport system permease subunit
MASATTAIRPVASLAVAGWLAACVAPLVLAGCIAAPIALVCYLAVAVQVGVHLRRLGTFGSLVALAYPVALTVFLVGVRPLARAHLRTGASQLEGPLPPNPMSQ